MPKRSNPPAFTWSNVSLVDQAYLMDLIGGDGHTIYSAPALIEGGVPAYVIDTFTQVERSDSSYKGSIFSTATGERQESMRGVYGLTVIRSLAAHYGMTSSKFGRGSEARELSEGIRVNLAKAATKEAGA